MPWYEILVQRVYLARTREEATYSIEASSPVEARRQVEAYAFLDRLESPTAWEVLKSKDAVKAVRICRIKEPPGTGP